MCWSFTYIIHPLPLSSLSASLYPSRSTSSQDWRSSLGLFLSERTSILRLRDDDDLTLLTTSTTHLERDQT